MKTLSKFEKEQWYKYRKNGCNMLSRCKINHLNFSIVNSYEHEEIKFKYLYSFIKEGHLCITEAVECSTGIRRDLVDLTTGEIYEFETDSNRAKRHDKHINVVMCK